MSAETVIPVRVCTARTVAACGQCNGPILPGEQYEDHRLPPGSELGNDHWLRMKIHAPRERNGCYTYGCDMAAAYRERARRLRGAVLARPVAVPIGPDLALLCRATRVAVGYQRATKDLIQRRVGVGFAKAGRLLLLLEAYGIAGPLDPGRPHRDVYVLPEDLPAVLSQLHFIAGEDTAHA